MYSTRWIAGLVVAVLAAACGEVKDTPDAGSAIDAAPDGAQAACTANALSCGANEALFMCDAEGSQLTKVQDCQYGCSTDHCKACQANTTFCNGNNLSSCDANGELSNPMTCMFGCQGMACNACMPSTTYCSGTNAVTCTAAGQPGASQACGAAGCQNGVCNSCTPNTTTCQGDNLVVCNAGGTVASATSCALGCSATGTSHCKVLVPSFGVPAPSGTQPDLNVNADATLDITNCAALDVKLTLGGVTSAVPSTQVLNVTQTGGYPICVVKYGKINVADTFTLNVVNGPQGHGLSLTATGDITIAGKIAFNTVAPGPSPGGTVSALGTNANGYYIAPGAGGAGGARAGGSGGACTGCSGASAGGVGGAAITPAGVLLSGSSGGNVVSGSTVYANGGDGGGALHLVSLTRVTVGATGVIALNGAGGTGCASLLTSQRPPCNSAGGGGSGGTLIVEAPTVNVSAGAIAAANGGGGAGGGWHTVTSGMFFFATHYNGQPGQLSMTRAAGGDIDNTTSGDGGYEADGTASPSANGAASDSGAATYNGGGGGGAKGFISLRGRAAANVMITFGAIISPAPSTGAVTAQ